MFFHSFLISSIESKVSSPKQATKQESNLGWTAPTYVPTFHVHFSFFEDFDIESNGGDSLDGFAMSKYWQKSRLSTAVSLIIAEFSL